MGKLEENVGSGIHRTWRISMANWKGGDGHTVYCRYTHTEQEAGSRKQGLSEHGMDVLSECGEIPWTTGPQTG